MEVLMHGDDLNEWGSVIPVTTRRGEKLRCDASGELLTSKMTRMGSRLDYMHVFRFSNQAYIEYWRNARGNIGSLN